jgi:branched-subunit amino acid aminotransferase/4-amino-4-deoxychorismate lyase
MLTAAPKTNAGDDTSRASASNDSYEEIILLNDVGELLEVTQTNFYVVREDRSIITADEGILHGSVRNSVLRACRAHGVEVKL